MTNRKAPNLFRLKRTQLFPCGYSCIKDANLHYEHKWALNYDEERKCFEWFIDYVIEQKKKFPHMKVYHYASYEPAALKRLKQSHTEHVIHNKNGQISEKNSYGNDPNTPCSYR